MRSHPHRPTEALLILAAGVCAALHVGKLAPAVGALQQALGLGLVEAGFLLSTVQLAGMLGALALGAWVDASGLRRGMVLGLLLLAGASAVGGFSADTTLLLALRAIEGLGFLLVVLSAPALLRQRVPAAALSRYMGIWGAYMPLGTALALLAGPAWVAALGWRSWWWMAAGLSAAMALAVLRGVRSEPLAPGGTGAAPPATLRARLRATLATPGPWWLALSFCAYSSQWLAVVGFLPAIYEQAGLAPGLRGLLTALAAAVNIAGNIAAGRLLQRGRAPVALLRTGYAAMAVAAVLAFAPLPLGPVARFLAVLCFSGLGGLIPATLFALSMRLAPSERTVATTVGWMQQWSAFGQFAGPPVVAWLASRLGGWHWSWAATGAASLAGLAISLRLAALLRPR